MTDQEAWAALCGTSELQPLLRVPSLEAIRLAFLAGRRSASDAQAQVIEKLVEAVTNYSIYAQARGSAPFGATEQERAALALAEKPQTQEPL